ncbi:methyltransferase domain-containing protein [candidate division KSB1 bacterium]|nr:methyltransferase domain-containing protein [candidate division KSB1 bacterium]NIV69432.1 methyltransferase domain-containing protein [Phycisphaerae bacterium]NIR70730.1 methyltransferase domain-containing protein [candidate division KSB1 bacterium]NIS27787.1 methyltransferase domain-containing protein [candidate division KSB1 bacterium]NIT74635.1 methyltransferase domain-containing protein [candidate division KSB1 bacterium]
MKNLPILTILATLFLGMFVDIQAQATYQPMKVEEKILKSSNIAVPTIQCMMCARRIEDKLASLAGIKEIEVDLEAKVALMRYDDTVVNLRNIEQAIASIGYHANNVKRDPEAYASLPQCCKEPKDRDTDLRHSDSRDVREHWQERDKWQNVPAIFEAMAIQSGSVVADIGAGRGYLTVRLAEAVGENGKVLAVDIDTSAVEFLRTYLNEQEIGNVQAILGKQDDPLLPQETLDAVVIVNSYHEMTAYQNMLNKIKASLRPGGHLVISEPISDRRLQASRRKQVSRHEIALQYVKAEVEHAGFEIVQEQGAFVKHDHADHQQTFWLLVAKRPIEG